ncbi:glycoside hydrolase [Photobacterium angustum]|uniref:glycoside hydrolase n=1 Tax=Photobacterium angustum TaxID=661 RepID=UPI000D15DC0E|nr:glycosyl hydrolase [Photobacterium angustum]PSW80167.1 glycosyl hydrolase [Photobacterium angustum]
MIGVFIATSISSSLSAMPTQAIQLKSVDIEPNSLAIKWEESIINQQALNVNGIPQKASNIVNISKSEASWILKPSNIKVNAKLNTNLTLSFKLDPENKIERNKPLTLTWFNLEEIKTKELYLPFSEGMRVPTSNKTWIKYLTENHNNSNTTQDLKMPFWTAKQGSEYISWHMVTPTNNSLVFSNEGNKLDMSSSHQFTYLNYTKPFTVSISRGKSWLSGAKNYRKWRLEHGYASTLIDKEKQNPDINKFIGANQVYLFGYDGISVQDVKDWWGLHNWLFNKSQLEIENPEVKELKNLVKGKDWLNHYQKQLMVDSINLALSKKYSAPLPSKENNTIEDQFNASQNKKNWLEKNASQFLTEPDKWGQAISSDIVNNFLKAGLTRLWLGFDNWMPAFYQPKAIEKAKKAGYLIGTYDSYNTAIPLSSNEGWLTAQIPNQIRKECAIELADGSKKTGFRGNGNYLNPLCEMEYVQKRISDIIRIGHFNSLFLDVDGTAMAREDYHLMSSESDILNGFNKRMQTIVDKHNIVLGSEDGNSLTTDGIVFAHGLETVGFGWQDKDMYKNRRSPYFLGRWYPNHKPEFFFKKSEVKEPYKTLLFSPKYRIPLYQVVFHDEVINSHHWHSDSLKFSNVKIERDLTAMLYNTPAMVHLSRDEMISPDSERLKQLKHYELGYKPIHEVLWNKQLIDFNWLTQDGLVQQTSYSDGSRIIANFTDAPIIVDNHNIKPLSILAVLHNKKPLLWTPLEVE